MKRLTSLDFLRGVAVLFMTLFHVFGVSFQVTVPSDITTLPPLLLILGVIGLNIMHWRGFFIMISGVVIFYQMFNALQNDKKRWQILIKQFLSGILLIILGKILITYFYFYGIIDIWTRSGGWNTDHLSMFFFFDTVESLGFMMILSGLVFFFLSFIKKRKSRVIIPFFVFFIMSITILIISPYVNEWVGQIAGIEIAANGEQFRTFGYAFDNDIKEKIIRVFLNALGGREGPLFPMWGVFLMGGAIAAILRHPEVKRWMIRVLFIPLILMLAWGTYELFALYGLENVAPLFHVFPRWFSFVSVSTQSMLILLFLRIIEFNPKLNKRLWLSLSKYFRRFGIYAFTVYWYQLLEAGPRLLLGALFGIESTTRSRLNGFWTAVTMIINLMIWSCLLYASDRWLHGIGSWEWILMVIRDPIKWWKAKKKGLDLDGMLHHVEVIQFEPKISN